MKKEEFKLLKELELLKHKNNLIELEIKHKNKVTEINMEKESRIFVESQTHGNKMSFHRLKRADERLKRLNSLRDGR